MAVTAICRPLEAVAGTLVPEGLIVSAGLAVPAACTTVQVRTSPLPATVIDPVRATAVPLDSIRYVTVPLVLPDAPAVIASQGAFVAAVHATLAVTAICRPLEAVAGTLVAVGAMASDAPLADQPIWSTQPQSLPVETLPSLL